MSIFSRRKRPLTQTSARASSGRAASGRAQFRKFFRTRTAAPAMPKMSSRRQFHRALRRHPAWPMVTEQAAARAKAHKEQEAARERLIKEQAAAQKQLRRAARRAKLHRLTRNHTNATEMPQTSSRAQVRRALRRYRALIVALVAVGALVALLNGIGGAFHGQWFPTPDLGGSPPPRYAAASTFDMARQETLIFGGFGQKNVTTPTAPNPELGDTWGWSGHTFRWTNRASVHAPSPRAHSSMAYDDARRVAVLFGGARSTTYLNETWTWDGTDWTLRNPPTSPPPRQKASMAYDAHRKLVVLFGGQGADGKALNDIWVWDGSAWKKLNPLSSPSSRHSAAMTYDVCRAEMVLFGGVPTEVGAVGTSTQVPGATGETWTWNGSVWTQQFPIGLSPTPRFGASMFYSTNTSRVVLYGGLIATLTIPNGPGTDEVLWIWDGKEWEPETTDPVCAVVYAAAAACNGLAPPPPRAYAIFEYDRSTGQPRTGGEGATFGAAHLFGGTLDPRTGVPHVDQWNWTESALIGTDNAHAAVRPFGCSSPIPVPPDEAAPVGGQSENVPFSKTEAREEIRETGRLPVLLGTPFSPGAPEPACRLSPPNESEPAVSFNHLATDPKRNRVYQFFMCQNARPAPNSPGKRGVLIQAYDGTTLKPIGSAIMPMPNLVGDSDGIQWGGKNPNPLHDVERGRFILRHNQDLWVISQDLIEKGVNPLVRKFTLPVAGTGALAFFNHPKTGRAKLLFAIPASPPAPISFVQWDIETSREDWRSQVSSCTGGVNAGWMLMRIEDRVYTTCAVGSGWGAVVRIPVVEAPNDPPEDRENAGTPEVFRGPPLHLYDSFTLGDAQSERVLILTVRKLAMELWVFDGKASRYVGRAVLAVSYGDNGHEFDQETGRLYMLVPNIKVPNLVGAPTIVLGGLRVVDTRLTPVPQAENFGQFSYRTQAAIGVLPPQPGLPRRVFIRRTGGSSFKYPDGEAINLLREDHYKVLADELSVPKQPELGQLDALTIPVPESAGKTEVSFDAEGSGYGIRLRSVGGIASVVRTPFSVNSTDVGFALDSVTSSEGLPPCYYPDRELAVGWVSNARLSDLETSARSLGLDVDSNSKSDLAGPSTKCLPPAVSPVTFPSGLRGVANVLWPLLPFTALDATLGPNLAWDRHFKEAECVGDSTASHEAKLGNVIPLGGVNGSVTCKQKETRVEGTSRGAVLGSTAVPYSVGEGTSSVVVTREPVRGVVVTSTAEATGIKLPGISIGLVKTEAVVWSNGRPSDKPRASFTRTICGVNNNPSCLNEQQQKDMVNGFNQLMGLNGKMTLPTPDPDFFKGSPGGYIAGVIKPLAEEVEDQYFARDYQREVPGLQIVLNKDSLSYGEGRQVLQLAAVRAITAFGVQCNIELIYSPPAKNCVALALDDAFVEEFEDSELLSEDVAGTEFDGSGGWMPVEAVGGPDGLALGQRMGRFIENLPIIRQLPIRQMGEALLAGSVWLLLSLPLALASRRFAMNLREKELMNDT